MFPRQVEGEDDGMRLVAQHAHDGASDSYKVERDFWLAPDGRVELREEFTVPGAVYRTVWRGTDEELLEAMDDGFEAIGRVEVKLSGLTSTMHYLEDERPCSSDMSCDQLCLPEAFAADIKAALLNSR